MDDMLCGVVFFHKTKRIDTHLKLNGFPRNAMRFDVFYKFGSKVKSRRWSCRGMFVLHRIDRLVFFWIAFIIGNVGWQRHMTRSMNGLIKRLSSGGFKAHKAPSLTALHKINDLTAQNHRRR